MEKDSAIGLRVQDAYTLLRRLGSGATGVVYEADAGDGYRVAVKLLHRELTSNAEVLERFQREAKIAAAIDSPHVAHVLGAGKTRDGRWWISFELLAGETLDARLERERPLPRSYVAEIVEHGLLGLEAAHAAGVVHRDIKPANLFLERSGSGDRLRILDFGVSKIRASPTAATASSLTAAEATLGNIKFMPPEQVRGSASVDGRADLYSLAAVAFLCLTGTMPFAGTTTGALLAFKRTRSAQSLASRTGLVWPDSAEAFFRRALARDPAKRFETAAEARTCWRDAWS